MRATIVLLCLMVLTPMSGSSASAASSPGLVQAPSLVVRVRMVCDNRRCIDPRTGAYSESACDRRGCYQSGPIIGYERGARGRDDEDRGERRGRRSGRGSEGFDCNRNRCIELRTGQVWESGCDGNYCYPTRPAPRYRGR